jgi:hypothetical protein
MRNIAALAMLLVGCLGATVGAQAPPTLVPLDPTGRVT